MEVLKPIPKYIKEKHFLEWKNSSVSQEIIELNVKSLDGNDVYEYLCYAVTREERRNDGRLPDRLLNRYKQASEGGWYCSGVDLVLRIPLTTLRDFEWGTFKPDKPRKSDGKIIKYEHPCNVSTEIFALKVPDSYWKDAIKTYQIPKKKEKSFWEWVLNNPLPILVTEGAKKAGCLLSAGYISVALPGVFNGFKDGELHPQLKALCQVPREITFCFDQDTKWQTRNDITQAIKKTGKDLENLACDIFVMVWDNRDGKGVDDFVQKNSSLDKLNEIYDARLSLEDYLEKHERAQKLDRKGFLKFLQTTFKDRLRFNELTYRVELDGKPLELNGELCFKFLEDYNIDVSDDIVTNGILHTSKKNSYHPVVKYLQECSVLKPANINNLANRYLGIKKDDPLSSLYNVFVKKWFIAAVARALEPGCKVDFALILHGRKQGTGKSTFFKIIGGEFASSSAKGDLNDTKTKLVLHKFWIQELAEFDRITRKQAADELKDFITETTDSFVRPYGRDAVDYPRRFILAGTVNKPEFLRDETGDRRFLVVPIPLDWALATYELFIETPHIWSAAYHAYCEGKKAKKPGEVDPWVITKEEYELLNKSNEQFRISDEWEYLIEDWLIGYQETTITKILEKVFYIEPAKQDRAVQMRVGAILTKLGWTKPTHASLDLETGKRVRKWLAPM